MSAAWPAVAVAAVVVGVFTAENVRTLRLRDVHTLRGGAVVAAVLAVSAAVAGDAGFLLGGLVGGAATFALLFLVVLAWPATLGFGTVKAGLPVGLAAGALGGGPWVASTVALAAALLATFLLGWARSREVPTGPALAVAFVAACVWAAVHPP